MSRGPKHLFPPEKLHPADALIRVSCATLHLLKLMRSRRTLGLSIVELWKKACRDQVLELLKRLQVKAVNSSTTWCNRSLLKHPFPKHLCIQAMCKKGFPVKVNCTFNRSINPCRCPGLCIVFHNMFWISRLLDSHAK